MKVENPLFASNLKIQKVVWLFVVFYPILFNPYTSQQLMHVCIFAVILTFVFLKAGQIYIRERLISITLYSIGLMSLYVVISLLNSRSIGIRDTADFIRPFVYLVYFVFPVLFPVSNEEFLRLFKFWVAILWFQVFYSILVFIPPLYPIVDLFKGRPSYDSVIFHFYRWSGTFIYPSDFSFYLSLFIYFYFHSFAFGKTNFFGRVKPIYLLLLLLFVLVMTVSRGGILSIVFVLGFFVLFSRVKFRKAILKLACVFTILGILLSIALIRGISNSERFNIGYLTNLVNIIERKNVDSSTLHRFKEMAMAFDYSKKFFPFGAGSDRENLEGEIPIIESYYGYQLIKWGYIGLAFSLLFYGYMLYQIFLIRRDMKYLNNSEFYSSFLIAGALLIISVPLIFGFSSAVTDRFKCLPFFYMICGNIQSIRFNVVRAKRRLAACG